MYFWQVRPIVRTLLQHLEDANMYFTTVNGVQISMVFNVYRANEILVEGAECVVYSLTWREEQLMDQVYDKIYKHLEAKEAIQSVSDEKVVLAQLRGERE